MLHEPQKGKIIGLSTEEKPDRRVIAGTHFIEVDTGLTYAWDGSMWREYVDKVGTYLFNTDTGEWMEDIVRGIIVDAAEQTISEMKQEAVKIV
jgi:hypothetical protein